MGKGALSAALVVKLFFDNIVRFFGIPGDLISDKDSRFTSSFWWELWSLLGTKKLISSTYYPQTDWQMKRTQKTLEQTLCSLLSEYGLDKAQWCIVLLKVDFALNF